MLGGRSMLPNVIPRDLRQPQTGQHNLLHRLLYSFGGPHYEAQGQMLRGEISPRDAALELLTNGPMGPFGAVRIPNPIRAFHGSPHQFDRFDSSRIGTGEGAQAYGHGLYFAENEGVARSYRPAGVNAGWSSAPEASGPHQGMFMATSLRGPNLDLVERRFFPTVDEARSWASSQVPPGHMYEVNIHARPEQFLDWDAPLSGQSPLIQQSIQDALRPSVRRTDQGAYAIDVGGSPIDIARTRWGANRMAGRVHESPAWESTFNPRTAQEFLARYRDSSSASGALQQAGIPGIRYFDQGSRSAGQGTRNYVVFDPEIVEILRRYGMLAPFGAAGLGMDMQGQMTAP
jgi:hypothetical protein